MKYLRLLAVATKSLDFVAQSLQMRQRLLVTTKRPPEKQVLRGSKGFQTPWLIFFRPFFVQRQRKGIQAVTASACRRHRVSVKKRSRSKHQRNKTAAVAKKATAALSLYASTATSSASSATTSHSIASSNRLSSSRSSS